MLNLLFSGTYEDKLYTGLKEIMTACLEFDSFFGSFFFFLEKGFTFKFMP